MTIPSITSLLDVEKLQADDCIVMLNYNVSEEAVTNLPHTVTTLIVEFYAPTAILDKINSSIHKIVLSSDLPHLLPIADNWSQYLSTLNHRPKAMLGAWSFYKSTAAVSAALEQLTVSPTNISSIQSNPQPCSSSSAALNQPSSTQQPVALASTDDSKDLQSNKRVKFS